MLRKKQETLIQFLMKQQQLTTSDKLAKSLHMSIRTVKSYISELNATYPDIISSSNRGYLIHKEKAMLLLQGSRDLPQDYESRCLYIVKKLLMEKPEKLNVYDLCEELFVSYSTLKNDISRMNTSFHEFHLTFRCEENTLCILGSEKDKRKLISHVMSEEASGNFLDLSFLQQSFPAYDVEKAGQAIRKLLQQHAIYVNDFSFINLLLHIVIMIHRIHHGNHMQSTTIVDAKMEDTIAESLCTLLCEYFHVTFTAGEQAEIHLLLETNANYDLQKKTINLQTIISKDILSLAKRLVTSVDEHFFIDLTSDVFFTPFALHLKNLQTRLYQHRIIKNPMLDTIKNTCPTIYDIATFLAYQLMQEFHSIITEDEIAFLALHVGTEIERQKKVETKVNAVILCPEYLHLGDMLCNQLLLDFGEQLTIHSLVSFEAELLNHEFDLLITTIPLSQPQSNLTVQLPPLPLHYQKSKVLDALNQIQHTKKSKLLAEHLDRYFMDDICLLPELNDKDTIIHQLCQKMMTLGYVHTDFEEEVRKRESASSTAFLNIAIPHPMKMSTYKTCIAVAISKEGILWDAQHIVHVVFLIAFHKIDQKHFHELYESLIMLFNEPEMIMKSRRCTCLQDFKQLIIQQYLEVSDT